MSRNDQAEAEAERVMPTSLRQREFAMRRRPVGGVAVRICAEIVCILVSCIWSALENRPGSLQAVYLLDSTTSVLMLTDKLLDRMKKALNKYCAGR